MYKSACIKVTSYVTAADTATLPLVSAPTTVRHRNMQWQNDYGKDGEKPSWISTKTSFHPGFWRQSLQFVSFCGKASGSIHIGAIWLCNVCPAGYTRTLIFYVLTIQFFTPAEQLRKNSVVFAVHIPFLGLSSKKNARRRNAFRTTAADSNDFYLILCFW